MSLTGSRIRGAKPERIGRTRILTSGHHAKAANDTVDRSVILTTMLDNCKIFKPRALGGEDGELAFVAQVVNVRFDGRSLIPSRARIAACCDWTWEKCRKVRTH